MAELVDCLYCESETDVEYGFDNLTEQNLKCNICGAPFKMHYDEDYDPETGDENCYFWCEFVER